jgi:hypothetical protein
MRTTLFAAALSVICALPAVAQSAVKVSFEQGGRVTIDANNATVRSILTEWSNKGGTKILGVERVAGPPVTLKLVNVPESQALEAVLRSVAGYVAAPARVATGPSMYDRIMIMATSSAPAPAAVRTQPANGNGAMAGTQRFIPPRIREEQREPDEQEEPDENPPNPPVFTFPQPGQQNGGFPGVNQPGMIQQFPNGNQQQFPNANQPNVVFNPPPSNVTQPSQPNMPIGVAQPGMMVPAPPQPPMTTPNPGVTRTPGPTRPPGQSQ